MLCASPAFHAPGILCCPALDDLDRTLVVVESEELLRGQKRGIALNAAHVTIRNSYIGEIKAIGQDSQAIAGWNGPGDYVIEMKARGFAGFTSKPLHLTRGQSLVNDIQLAVQAVNVPVQPPETQAFIRIRSLEKNLYTDSDVFQII